MVRRLQDDGEQNSPHYLRPNIIRRATTSRKSLVKPFLASTSSVKRWLEPASSAKPGLEQTSSVNDWQYEHCLSRPSVGGNASGAGLRRVGNRRDPRGALEFIAGGSRTSRDSLHYASRRLDH
jgi:hypothetical protein